ncbi:hypothetical protein CJ263_16605 [Maribacter cobaltidurans]|uniref:Uncharacterized protein n=1 Tax=Maribacter cobaltidurans TaxID=1178778 RepID=A0A223V8H1_9FLAO|nr:hypothetical protein CJ263_16605 [Maribacter cobaltidurans]
MKTSIDEGYYRWTTSLIEKKMFFLVELFRFAHHVAKKSSFQKNSCSRILLTPNLPRYGSIKLRNGYMVSLGRKGNVYYEGLVMCINDKESTK